MQPFKDLNRFICGFVTRARRIPACDESSSSLWAKEPRDPGERAEPASFQENEQRGTWTAVKQETLVLEMIS